MAAVLERDCCSICLGDYKDPRILPCQHVFCCQCLLDYVAKKKQINCPNCMTEVEIPPEGVEALPKVVDEPLQESTEPKDCDVCEKGNQAAFQCFECDTSMCDACKKYHDKFSSNHPIYELKAADPESFCESHPKSFLKFYCKSCKYLICQLCLDDGHDSKHSVRKIEDYFTEKKKQFEDYQTKIDGRLQNISEVTERYISRQTKNFDEVMKHIPKIEEITKSNQEIAHKRKKLKTEEDKKFSQKLTSAIKHLDKPLNKSTNIKDILDLTRNIEAKIENHQKDPVEIVTDESIETELGTLDVTVGRLFSFKGLPENEVFFVGGIHWSVTVKTKIINKKSFFDITLKPFVKEEDKELVESVTADLVFTVTCENDSVVKKLSKTFSSCTDSFQRNSIDFGFGFGFGFGFTACTSDYSTLCTSGGIFKNSRNSDDSSVNIEKLTCTLPNNWNEVHRGKTKNFKILFDIKEIKYKKNLKKRKLESD